MDFLSTLSALTLLKTSVYIANNFTLTDYRSLYDEYPTLQKAVTELTNEDLKQMAHFDDPIKLQYEALLMIMSETLSDEAPSLAPICQNVLDLCLTHMLYPEFGIMLNTTTKTLVNLRLAFGIAEITTPSYHDYFLVAKRIKVLFNLQMEVFPFYLQNIEADNRLFAFLYQDEALPPPLHKFVTLHSDTSALQQLYVNEPLLTQLQELSLIEHLEILHIAGERGSGRTLLLSHFCRQLGLRLFLIDCRKLALLEAPDVETLLFLLKRECYLNPQLLLCFHGVGDEIYKKLQITPKEFACSYIEPFTKEGIGVCVCSERETAIACYVDAICFKLEIPECNMHQRIQLWHGYCRQYNIDESVVDCVHYGTKYKLSPSEIQKVVLQLSYYTANHLAVTDKLISSICGEIIPPPASGRLQRIKTDFTLDDLILPRLEKEQLKALCTQIWYSNTVYTTWNLQSKYSYGTGVTALFTGPPGTGKTMAAHAIANALNLPLFKADLSQIADKYIGESEKHLEEIFSATEKSNTILFFDEADSLFGKRSDVNDSKDKFANNEVSYVLQRIERYDGIVLLATNFQNNIDSAFLRRMRYVIQFPLPDYDSRLKIWKSCLIKDLPTKDLNLDYLAENFILTGSNIKNVVLSAAFMAASEQSPITMKHILIAVRSECAKSGKKVLNSDLGFYSDLFKEEA